MKYLYLSLFFCIPIFVHARHGWRLTNYSLSFGIQSDFKSIPIYHLDLLYDHSIRTCIVRPVYYAIGLSYNLNKNRSELGFITKWNPTYFVFQVSRNTKFFPYIFGEFNAIHNNTVISNRYFNAFNFRPGLGMLFNFFDNKIITLKSALQFGYSIPLKKEQIKSYPIVIQYSIGFGVNTLKLKKDAAKKTISNEQNSEKIH